MLTSLHHAIESSTRMMTTVGRACAHAHLPLPHVPEGCQRAARALPVASALALAGGCAGGNAQLPSTGCTSPEVAEVDRTTTIETAPEAPYDWGAPAAPAPQPGSASDVGNRDQAVYWNAAAGGAGLDPVGPTAGGATFPSSFGAANSDLGGARFTR